MEIRTYTALLFLSILVSCISTLDIDTGEEEKILVVEGYITTAPGPYKVRLTRTAKYGSIFDGVIRRETGADIWITDEAGNATFLIDMEYGEYQTPPEFQGEIGKTYVLNITTAVGEKFASVPETILPVPEIESLYYQFRKTPTSDPSEFNLGIGIVATWMDPADQSNFYLWRNSGVYSLKTFPQDYVIPGPFPGVAAPKDCCDQCWVKEYSPDSEIILKSDLNTDGMLNTQQVAFVSDNGRRFMDRYKITIDQLSLSTGAFKFLSLMRDQLSIDGDIFDPPPATVRGNIINLANPDANVIGYFYASDIRSFSIFVNGQDLPERLPSVKINDDCRLQIGASAVKPLDWE